MGEPPGVGGGSAGGPHLGRRRQGLQRTGRPPRVQGQDHRGNRGVVERLEAEAALPVPPDIDNEFPVLRWKSEDYVPPEK